VLWSGYALDSSDRFVKPVISYLHGTLKRKQSDRVIIEVGGVGYDVFLPEFVMRTLIDRREGDDVELEIYYHVTDRQLRPTLIGFNNGFEKKFFEKFISVEDIGPLKAVRALTMSVSTIAEAIESSNTGLLRQLPGIGDRTAQKMVATLRGKVAEEALLRDEGFQAPVAGEARSSMSVREDSIEILASLGYRRSEAATKVDAALKRSPELIGPEDVIREVYRAERAGPLSS
jgi:holliday junction DNA helicase RuvA